MEVTRWMGQYGDCECQKVFKSTGPLTDVRHPTRLNAQEQRELQGRMEKKQMKEFMTVSLKSSLCSSPSHIQALEPRLVLNFAHHVQLRCTRSWSKDALTTVSTILQPNLFNQRRKDV